MNTVSDYMKSEKFSSKQTRDILGILERKLDIKKNVKLIDIFPDHQCFVVILFLLTPRLLLTQSKLDIKKLCKFSLSQISHE
jgi:hypothetical protein